MSNRSEVRVLRSEGIHFKNKYKFMVLKITLMPQINEAFVGSSVNTKSALKYSFEFCSDVSFIGTVFSRNWHVLFVLGLFKSDLTFVFLLLSLLVFVQPDISKIFFRIMSEKKKLFTQKYATNYETYLENQLNNFWT
jgi:Na+-transporting methylmalonyl-CoA/oxaloacetate decarboxylase gamma subunit